TKQEILGRRIDRHRRHVRRPRSNKQPIEERPVGFVVANLTKPERAVRRSHARGPKRAPYSTRQSRHFWPRSPNSGEEETASWSRSLAQRFSRRTSASPSRCRTDTS